MTFSVLVRATAFACVLMLSGHAVAAQLPEPVTRMIDAAAKSGNPSALDTVAGVAKTAYPDDAADIDRMVARLKAAADTAHLAALKQQRFLQGWKGNVEIGASRTTGNTDDTDIAFGLHLNRDGIDWRHKFNATADYQHTQGTAGTEKYLVGYEADYKFNAALYSFGLLQWEKDHFAGFDGRETESLGFGYSIIHRPKLTWDVTVGPAFRQTNQVIGPMQTDTEARLASQLTWNVSPSTAFTENISVYAGGGDNTYESTTAFTTKVINALAARTSFDVKKETSPSPGFKKTDTTSRVTLVYGF